MFPDGLLASEVPGVLILVEPPAGLSTSGTVVVDQGDASLNPPGEPTHDFDRTSRPQGSGLDRGHSER